MQVQVSPIKRVPLEVTKPAPLDLKPVQFHVMVQNGEPLYCVDTRNFTNLSNNIEQTQNRLDLDEQTIIQILHYYDEDLPTTVIK